GEGGGQHPAEIGLVDLALGDVVADAPYACFVGGAVQGGRPRVGGGAAPGGGRPRQGCGTHVVEAGAHGFALVVDDDRPPAGSVEGGQVGGDVPQPGGEAAADMGEIVLHLPIVAFRGVRAFRRAGRLRRREGSSRCGPAGGRGVTGGRRGRGR